MDVLKTGGGGGGGGEDLKSSRGLEFQKVLSLDLLSFIYILTTLLKTLTLL